MRCSEVHLGGDEESSELGLSAMEWTGVTWNGEE